MHPAKSAYVVLISGRVTAPACTAPAALSNSTKLPSDPVGATPPARDLRSSTDWLKVTNFLWDTLGGMSVRHVSDESG